MNSGEKLKQVTEMIAITPIFSKSGGSRSAKGDSVI